MILKFLSAYALVGPAHELLEATTGASSTQDREAVALELEEHREAFIETLSDAGLWDDVTPDERAVFETPVDELSEQQVVDIAWRAEAVECLVWALGLLEALAPYDAQTDPEAVMSLVDAGSPVAFIALATLRPREEIERARAGAELWHWRSRAREREERGDASRSGESSIDETVRRVARRAAADGLIPSVVDGDFGACGKAYRTLTEPEWIEMRSIAMERHFALNWLCGRAPDNAWDDTPTDT